jgi:hypothetical protein
MPWSGVFREAPLLCACSILDSGVDMSITYHVLPPITPRTGVVS